MRLSLRDQLRIWKIMQRYAAAIANDDAALCYEYDEEIYRIEVGDED